MTNLSAQHKRWVDLTMSPSTFLPSFGEHAADPPWSAASRGAELSTSLGASRSHSVIIVGSQTHVPSRNVPHILDGICFDVKPGAVDLDSEERDFPDSQTDKRERWTRCDQVEANGEGNICIGIHWLESIRTSRPVSMDLLTSHCSLFTRRRVLSRWFRPEQKRSVPGVSQGFFHIYCYLNIHLDHLWGSYPQ